MTPTDHFIYPEPGSALERDMEAYREMVPPRDMPNPSQEYLRGYADGMKRDRDIATLGPTEHAPYCNHSAVCEDDPAEHQIGWHEGYAAARSDAVPAPVDPGEEVAPGETKHSEEGRRAFEAGRAADVARLDDNDEAALRMDIQALRTTLPVILGSGSTTTTISIHMLDRLYRALVLARSAPVDRVGGEGLREVHEVRYDDDEAYHVAARFSDKGAANTLRDRLAAAHHAADKDGCHLDPSWQVVTVAVDDVRPDVELPADLFWHSDYEAAGEEHASVDIDRVDLSFRAALVNDETPGGTE